MTLLRPLSGWFHYKNAFDNCYNKRTLECTLLYFPGELLGFSQTLESAVQGLGLSCLSCLSCLSGGTVVALFVSPLLLMTSDLGLGKAAFTKSSFPLRGHMILSLFWDKVLPVLFKCGNLSSHLNNLWLLVYHCIKMLSTFNAPKFKNLLIYLKKISF